MHCVAGLNWPCTLTKTRRHCPRRYSGPYLPMKQSLQLKLGQQLTMTPQLQQAIRLLQLSTMDLQQEIQEALGSNPLLEVAEEDEPGESRNGKLRRTSPTLLHRPRMTAPRTGRKWKRRKHIMVPLPPVFARRRKRLLEAKASHWMIQQQQQQQ
jgi:DNA-directed RNA polymerase specialized sigma54-like protein